MKVQVQREILKGEEGSSCPSFGANFQEVDTQLSFEFSELFQAL